MKKFIDLICATMGIVLLSPLLVAIARAIRREDHGPVFYRGERVGLNGRPFRIFKFRTMVVNADKLGGSSTPDDDPRITRIGRKLRKCKLDELPQLFNVFLGDMSLVGPRPEVKRFTDLFTPEEMTILTVRPGITDWASLWNPDEGSLLAGAEDPDRAYLELIRPTKLKLQLNYTRHRSLLADLKIILLTLVAIIRPQSRMVLAARHGLALWSRA
jgi:lipopolysaccharide/colanic/teichoic acid biosynthesis glycosyltransferase